MTKNVDYYAALLEPWFERWNLMTQSEREIQRRQSNAHQMQGLLRRYVAADGGPD